MGKKRNYIKRVSRSDPMFSNRVIAVISANSKTVIPVPDRLIVCDACNDEIKTDQINLLVLDRHVWGAICEKCRLRYHKKLAIIEG